MKPFYNSLSIIFPLIMVFISINDIEAGTRYKDIVFNSVTVKKDIQFGSNTALNGSDLSLKLDFYEPTNDTLELRPLIVCIHGGSLILGDRREMDQFCNDFARRGYTAATIDYRIGIEAPKGVKTILEALLRGVQDAKAAVRFFRSKAVEYGIDTSKIYLEGSSAGSMIAVHYAYWDEDEIPLDVNQTKWGDIEGNSGNPGYSTEIKGIVNYCGAIENPAWINAGEVPVANLHGLLDTVVPADSGISTDFGIKLFGGVAISRIATQLGIYNHRAFFPLSGHGGNEDSLRVFSSNFFYSLMVLSSSKADDFTSLSFPAKSLRIFRYDNYTFEATALDKNGNLIILPSSMVQFSCDSKIGTIEPYGVFTPGANPDSGYVYVTFNNTINSCYVRTYDVKYFVIVPKNVVTDTIKTLKINIDTYDADSVKHNLPITMFKLTSTNSTVGTIDSLGNFRGEENGTTYIIASFNGYSDTATVNVEGASGIVSFDELESLDGWTLTGNNLDSLSVSLSMDQKSAGNASFKIYYTYTYDPQSGNYMIYLNKDLPVFGIPDSIYLDVKSNGLNHKLYYLFSDINSGTFRGFGKKYLNDSSSFDNVNAPMTGLAQQSGNPGLTYPLTLNRIEIQLAGSTVKGSINSGIIYVDNLRLKYPGNITGVENNHTLPGSFSLEQNYPNPFNPSTVIGFSLIKSGKISLKVYDILGREVADLINRELGAGYHSVLFNASGLSSGVYFYKLETNEHSTIKKMILLK